MNKLLFFLFLYLTYTNIAFSRSFPEVKVKMFMMHSSSEGVQVIVPKTPFDIGTLKLRTRSDWFESVESLNDQDLRVYLEDHITRVSRDQDLNSYWVQESIENFIIKRRMSRATHLSEDELVSFSADQIKHKSFEQKVNFFRSLMLDISFLYDYKRVKGEGDIEIGLVRVFKALNNLYESDKKTREGICRDMHQSVLRIMNKAGIDTALGSSYVTVASAHINIIFTDPNDKNKVIGLNYEHLDYRSGKPGQSLLTMNHMNPSIGLGFYMWNEKDRVELYVPSDKSILLYRATNGNLEEFNPFILEEDKLIQAQAKTSLGILGLFYAVADSGDGTHVTGISLNDKFKFKTKLLDGDHGSAFFLSRRSMGLEEEDGSVTTVGYYGRAFLELLKEIQVGESSSIKFNLTSLIQFAAFYAKVESEVHQLDEGKFKLDGSLAIGAGVHFTQKYSLFDSTLHLSIEGIPQTADITMFSLYHPFAAGFEVGFSRLLLGQDITFKRLQWLQTKLQWKLMYQNVRDRNMILGQIGAEMRFKRSGTNLGFRVQDCLSDNCHVWMIGSRGSFQFNVLNDYFERFSFGANGMINEYDFTQYYFGLLLRGNL